METHSFCRVLVNFPKTLRNGELPQKLHTRKLGEISVFYEESVFLFCVFGLFSLFFNLIELIYFFISASVQKFLFDVIQSSLQALFLKILEIVLVNFGSQNPPKFWLGTTFLFGFFSEFFQFYVSYHCSSSVRHSKCFSTNFIQRENYLNFDLFWELHHVFRDFF